MKLPKNFTTIGPELRPYQLESFIFCLWQDSAGLLLDMGSGKSCVAINVARYRIQTSGITKILVVCPTSVMYNWVAEVHKWSEYKPVIIHDSREDRIEKIKSSGYQFGIINYESLYPILRDLQVLNQVPQKKSLLLINNWKEVISRLNFGMIIFDESARFIKNHNTKRTFASQLFADTVKYKLILTGTPISNKPLDVWSQFRVLDGGETLGRDFYAFRNYFFFKHPPNKFGQFFIKKDLIPVLSSKIYKKCIRKKKEDVLKDLPPQIFQTIPIEMDSNLKNIYIDVKRQIISEIETMEGKTVLVISSILAKLMRLQQITAGFTVKDNKTVELVHKPKLNALLEMLEIIVENEESAIVWCRFLKSIDMISQSLNRLKIKHLTMSGEDKDKEKYAKWKGFQTSDIPIFVGQVESGGLGIELFKLNGVAEKTQHSIFYENTFSLDVREQAKARVHRIGQKSTCLYLDLVVKDSIDEMILNSLVQKKSVADKILEVGVKKFLEVEK